MPALNEILKKGSGAPVAGDLLEGGIAIDTLNGRVYSKDQGGLLVDFLTKAKVGLDLVDNTADLSKPVSTAGQTALDLKAKFSDLSVDGVISGFTIATSANLESPILAGVVYVSGSRVVTIDTPNTFTASVDTYVDIDAAGTFVFSEVVLGGAAPTLTSPNQRLAKVVTDATTVASVVDMRSLIDLDLALKAPIASPTFTGTVGGITKAMVGLTNVDDTSDATKDSAIATLTNKTLTSPVINTPTGIVKGDVGLSLVDNTSDASKPVSTATQTALDLKQNSLTFDTVPTDTSTNPVESNGVFDALALKQTILSPSLVQVTDATLGTGTHTFNYATGNMQQLTATGNITIAFSNFVTGEVCAYVVDAVNWGAFTITYPVGIQYDSALAPTLTAAGTDRLLFLKDKDEVLTMTVHTEAMGA